MLEIYWCKSHKNSGYRMEKWVKKHGPLSFWNFGQRFGLIFPIVIVFFRQ